MMALRQHLSRTAKAKRERDISGSRPTDERLALAVCGGSRDAFEQLYDYHIQPCFGLALQIISSHDAAEKVVHDVFTRFWKEPQSYSPGDCQFSAWLLAAVHKQSVQTYFQIRRQRLSAAD